MSDWASSQDCTNAPATEPDAAHIDLASSTAALETSSGKLGTPPPGPESARREAASPWACAHSPNSATSPADEEGAATHSEPRDVENERFACEKEFEGERSPSLVSPFSVPCDSQQSGYGTDPCTAAAPAEAPRRCSPRSVRSSGKLRSKGSVARRDRAAQKCEEIHVPGATVSKATARLQQKAQLESGLEPATQQAVSRDPETPSVAAGAPAPRRFSRASAGSPKKPEKKTVASPFSRDPETPADEAGAPAPRRSQRASAGSPKKPEKKTVASPVSRDPSTPADEAGAPAPRRSHRASARSPKKPEKKTVASPFSRDPETPADEADAPAPRRSHRASAGSPKKSEKKTVASPAPASSSNSLRSGDSDEEDDDEDDPYDFTIPGTHKEPTGRRHLSAVPLDDTKESVPYPKPLPPGWWATRQLHQRKGRDKPETRWTFHHKHHAPVRNYEVLIETFGVDIGGEAGASQNSVDGNGWRNNKVTAKRPAGHAGGASKKAKPKDAAQPVLELFRFTSKSGPPRPPAAAAASSSRKEKDAAASSQESHEPTAPDFLQELLSGAKERKEHDKLVAAKVAEEVEKIMDNGIRVKPMFRAMYGATKPKATEANV